ncbi:MAG TPA: chemotaxis-specific protein-glutamate methyltransferase CheB [Myxococcales bacterium]|jgi:two-component system chemotaxis response regulator CheB|nr:chemotaxis-specific protein-glutamate methyltransferase CheB [Myxococcales bacterium]
MTRRDPIRVLVADDSATMRSALISIFAREQDLRVVGEARDGFEAVEKARELRPDVITMDVNMPRLDGLGATAAIMAEAPARVLMVCAVSEERQLDLPFRAMAVGALEVIAKPDPTAPELNGFGRRVAEAVRLMAEVPVVRRHGPLRRPVAHDSTARVCGIGLVASTGGPPALSVVLRSLPPDLPVPVLVAQHIAAGFTPGLTRWLSELSSLPVRAARDGEIAGPGRVYFAPDGCDLELSPDGRLHTPRSDGLHSPSGNRLLHSLARSLGSRAAGVVMTGMGDDGAQGLLAIRHAGGAAFAQDEATSVVFGMPAAARNCGAAETLLPLEDIAPMLAGLCSAPRTNGER